MILFVQTFLSGGAEPFLKPLKSFNKAKVPAKMRCERIIFMTKFYIIKNDNPNEDDDDDTKN